MTTIIFTFFLAFLAAFFLTPFIGKVARRLGIVDVPSDRKVHDVPIPRIGGVALFFSFFFPLCLLIFNKQMYADLVETDARLVAFVAGAVLIFALGLWDDIHHLPSSLKFAGQILVGVLVYYGGIKIQVISVPFVDALNLGNMSLPITVFWFVLVINAINLIDGLDGLAAGIGLFVSLTMLVICLTNKHLLEAIGFAALGGSLLGFLRYNFNPASIFLGDCGSYLLGYLLAALSVLGSVKGQFASAMLIPVLALGIPLIDTLWTPIRRFALGRKMFQPDSGHLHHTLIRLGYSQRRAVLLIYGCTIILGIGSIILVHSKDETAALILVVVGSGVILAGRFVGIRLFHGPGRIRGWLHEVSDATGLTYERRSFVNHQVAITKSRTIDAMWQETCRALEALDIHFAELVLYTNPLTDPKGQPDEGALDQHKEMAHISSVTYSWQSKDRQRESWLNDKGFMKIEQPLLSQEEGADRYYGTIILIKDIHDQATSHYMLTRIEHLRRTLNATLDKIHLNK